ncbi:aldo/keto reductase family protein [Rhodoglobus vestalii]|uniref:Aldo/keto reductase family protein n=1 Tax=Rhodoglobus vestalii TaxID=193384 RepID=A0A8H2KBA2_9MICO|nr:aldo/keto reductase family protein [Rhodoglobus vestalii]
MRDRGTPLVIHQPSYSMFNGWAKDGLLDTVDELGLGVIAFSPLAQGLLTDRYLGEIPADSRTVTRAVR